VDLARSEAVEAELSRLIEKRSTREVDRDEREEFWRESVRAYTARRREEMRAASCDVPLGPGRAAQGRPEGPDSPSRGRGREACAVSLRPRAEALMEATEERKTA